MKLRTTRCSEEGNGCEEFHTLYFDNLCNRITDNNPVFKELMAKITPKIKCPVKPVGLSHHYWPIINVDRSINVRNFVSQALYDLSAGILNFALLNHLPLGGFNWGVHVFIYHSNTKNMVFCANFDAKFMRFNERRRPRNWNYNHHSCVTTVEEIQWWFKIPSEI